MAEKGDIGSTLGFPAKGAEEGESAREEIRSRLESYTGKAYNHLRAREEWSPHPLGLG